MRSTSVEDLFLQNNLTMAASDILIGLYLAESKTIKMLTTVLKFYNFT